MTAGYQGYNGGINAHRASVKTRFRRVFVGVTLECERSVKEGSTLTGAPGQPVDTGYLRASWIPEFLTRWTWVFFTNASYARDVENNVRNVRFRNHGPHSVKLTFAAFGQIVAAVARRVVGGAP